MILDEGEIITAGLDGYVRSWSLEHIDQAEVDEESAIIEMEPLNEVLIGRNVQIMYLSTYIVSSLLLFGLVLARNERKR